MKLMRSQIACVATRGRQTSRLLRSSSRFVASCEAAVGETSGVAAVCRASCWICWLLRLIETNTCSGFAACWHYSRGRKVDRREIDMAFFSLWLFVWSSLLICSLPLPGPLRIPKAPSQFVVGGSFCGQSMLECCRYSYSHITVIMMHDTHRMYWVSESDVVSSKVQYIIISEV